VPTGFRLAIFASVLVLVFSAVTATASTADKMRKTYAQVRSMRASFTQVLFHKESGSREKRSGTLSFKKPLLVRWESKAPSEELLLVGKDAIWNAFPDEELVYKYSLDMAEDSSSLIRVITGQARFDNDFELEAEEREGDMIALRLFPKQPDQSLVEARLWVDATNYLIKKMRVYDFYGNENEIAFSKQEIDIPLKDSLFTYKPPKDFIVEDMSKENAAVPRKKPLLR
jgi:outer membrane lipoprotein carrier protein